MSVLYEGWEDSENNTRDFLVVPFFFLPFFVGKKPIKVKASEGSPDALIAAVKADAPGIGITSIPSLIHCLIKLYPGSLIVGVPASEINATSLLSLRIPNKRAISYSLL